MNPYMQRVVESTGRHAEELARQHCTKLPCGLQGVVMTVPPLTQRDPGSNVVWMEGIEHGVGCEYDTECPFAQNPNEVTNVFTEAMHLAMEETGIFGLVDRPDITGIPRDN